jgi:short-chain Z-isoprenyl diphosphate synthase
MGAYPGRDEVIQQFAYQLYTKHLQAKIQQGLLPQHVAVILDGNRRFAESNGSSSVSVGYRQGAHKVSQLLDWCQDLCIPQVTLWVLSADNLKRPPDQVRTLCQVIEEEIVGIANGQRESRTPRSIRFFGQMDALAPSLRESLAQASDITRAYDQYYLNIGVAYGGREEIVYAVRSLLESYHRQGLCLQEAAVRVSTAEIESHLYLTGIPEPDLIIRTSGEVRLSGFLMWQSVYSEYYFCDAYWPAFRKLDLLRAIRSFQQRKRRFGR